MSEEDKTPIVSDSEAELIRISAHPSGLNQPTTDNGQGTSESEEAGTD